MTASIHILEPTLVDHRGHARSLVQRICDAGTDQRFRVWAARGAPPDLIKGKQVELRPWFRRRMRMPQLYVKIRRLLREEGVVCVSTAGRTEVLLVDRAMGTASPARTFLYVHWLHPSTSRLRALTAIARRRPELRLAGATESVCGHLLDCGFRNVRWIPYPMESPLADPTTQPTFRRVLFAGSARRDKGFHQFVELVDRWKHSGRNTPVVVQVGGDYFGRMTDEVREDVARLGALAYPALQTRPSGLDPASYRDQFQGAVCVQLYDPIAFEDRASGVTLDAFSAGAPVVTRAGTWIARQVERFGAGAVADEADVDSVSRAIDRVTQDYGTYAEGARQAGRALSVEHHPRRLLDAILGE